MSLHRLRIPISTYRLQFNQSFTFKQAADLVPYLHALGITDCYSSPYLKAVSGSTHGYDVVDPSSLNPEIGNEDDYQLFISSLKSHEMGQLLDTVPNHMGIANSSNPWWQDVLENGPSSRYAPYFDINWAPVKPELENKVLLPILGDQYGIVLENQEITLRFADGQFYLQYYEHRLPLDPVTWTLILSFRTDELVSELAENDPHLQEYQSILTALSHLPLRDEDDPDRIAERYREKEVIRRRLSVLQEESTSVERFLQENVRILNGDKGSHRSFDLLDALVSDQAYRLAYWRVASEEINYRRFFDINELAAIRMEHPGVFEDVHQLIFELLRSGAVTSLRIDHVDGLYDPSSYLRQWQSWAQENLEIPLDDQGRSLFMVVEKILGKGESLSNHWPIHGTTGYEFLNLLNHIFVNPKNQRAFHETYHRYIKEHIQLEDLIYKCKKLIMSSSMSSEINVLGHQLNLLSERNRRSRDFTLNNLIFAVREIVACFPIYRTYVTQDPQEDVLDRDRMYIRLAVARAKRKNPTMSNLVFDFVRELLLKLPGEGLGLEWEEANPFVMKFQQTTSPVTAKGVEDTVFYIYNRFISLNEVGGEADQFGLPLQTFHEKMRERQALWPHSLSATSTHDTKRSEDVRARLAVLSEIPQEWRRLVNRWHRLNRKTKPIIEEQALPDRNEEYLLYQILLGAWPWEPLNDQEYQNFCGRIQDYMNKSLKEAKVHSSWINPDDAYEAAVGKFITKILSRERPNPFLEDFLPFQDRMARYGLWNSLSQLLIKVTAPGIPDFYQGTELWNFTLVDPDNRQPINYDLRRHMLEELQEDINNKGLLSVLKTLLENPIDGKIKLFVTMSSLHFRRNHPGLFLDGRYQGLESSGEQAQHVCAFARIHKDETTITVTPQYVTDLIADPTTMPMGKEVWGETCILLSPELANGQYHNILTGEILKPVNQVSMPSLPLHAIFQHFPVALLERVT